ncbi:TRIM3 [Branchiostoma lanceolatum]|uniref:TRIM3 protein n=1 Tax=Branchiostoma lanceolatum TaxID=7740 RepID=A0A8K0F225_BRALA|nr:TRIM3 [Branchiostoma lanceolatum]
MQEAGLKARQTKSQTGRASDRQSIRQTEHQADRESNGKIDFELDRESDRDSDRQTVEEYGDDYIEPYLTTYHLENLEIENPGDITSLNPESTGESSRRSSRVRDDDILQDREQLVREDNNAEDSTDHDYTYITDPEYAYIDNTSVVGLVEFHLWESDVNKHDTPGRNDYRLALDKMSDRAFVTETDGHRGQVNVFWMNGMLKRKFGRRQGLVHPTGITVDNEDRILVADSYTAYIYVYRDNGQFLFKFAGKGSNEDQLNLPIDIGTDSSRNIIVADSGNKRVELFTNRGELIRHIATDCDPLSIAVGPDGQLVLIEKSKKKVTVLMNY